jgi:hypothetical protein
MVPRTSPNPLDKIMKLFPRRELNDSSAVQRNARDWANRIMNFLLSYRGREFLDQMNGQQILWKEPAS